MADLTMKRGDSRTVVFTFNGTTTFVEGDVVRFTAKLSHGDDDADAVIALTSTGGQVALSGASASATIPPSATNSLGDYTRLFYDWQLVTPGGTVRTLDEGRIYVTPDITRTTT